MVEADLNKENEEENFSDPEDYVDDISDDKLVPDVLRQEPSIDEYEDCCVIAIGLPVVGADRAVKLQAVVNKILTSVNQDFKAHFPTNPDGGSKGCVFVEYNDKTMAEYAQSVLNGYKLDKNHTFSAFIFSELRRMKEPEKDWKAPEPTAYSDVGDLWWWLQHNRCRDQLAVQYEKNGNPTVGVYWHLKGHDPEIVGDNAERANWTDAIFKWSPHGSYMTTMHERGVLLWGGPEFKRCQRFEHERVQFMDFSPRETYLVTYAQSSEVDYNGFSRDLRIWDVRTGELKTSFSLYQLTRRESLPTWPLFNWSFDEKFFACFKAPEKDKLEKEKKINGISIFDTEKFALVDRRPLIIENIKQFLWCPTAPILAYYSEETETLPAEFVLMQYPSQQKLRSGRFYNVADAKLFWQPNGKRFAAYTARFSKKTTKETGEVKYVGGLTYNLEIFEIDKKDVALMNVQLPEPFIHFAWEPNGDKFAVLTGNQAKATPYVYKIEPNVHAPKLMSKLDSGVQYNEVSFSPNGGWLAVMARLSTGGNIMFVDTTLQEAKRTNVVEHPGFNKGCWDPTGRYFVTCATTQGRVGADHGFRIYTFQGRELCRKNMERMVQFQWRPRPPVNLSEAKLKEIKKNLKKTAARFDREDNEEKCRASQEVVEKRRKIMSAFEVIRQKNLKNIQSQRDKRLELRGGVDTSIGSLKEDLVEETITIAIGTQKTLAPLELDAADMAD